MGGTTTCSLSCDLVVERGLFFNFFDELLFLVKIVVKYGVFVVVVGNKGFRLDVLDWEVFD